MMGRQDKGQDQLFYQFNLDELVPQDHLLRHIDRVLDLSGLREHLAPYYSTMGRPSVDPELMIRMLLICYCLGIRSERRLCEEVQFSQLVQRSRHEITARLVVSSPLLQSEESKIAKALAEAMGGHFKVRLEYVDEIPRAATGKFFETICEVDEA
jgi:hypothetical protein